MEIAIISIIIGLLLIFFLFTLVYAYFQRQARIEAEKKHTEIEKKQQSAKLEAEKMLKLSLVEAKELAQKENQEFDKSQREKNIELQKAEKRIQKREESIEKKAQQLEEKEKELQKLTQKLEHDEKQVEEALKSVDFLIGDAKLKLEEIAGLSTEEARKKLTESLEADVKKMVASDIKIIEDEIKKTSEERARAIIATSIQKIANEFVSDSTVSVINLPTDDMKGRIIGREGRNIRAIEQATGVDLIIDDTPEAVVVSCFNPIRREIGKIVIEKLVADGRIHPARIEEVVNKVKQEFDDKIKDTGEKAAFESGVQGLHPEVIVALGKLKYRTNGQQSVLQHSLETAHIAGIIAAELEFNTKLARRVALLHDIGKALDEEHDDHHAKIGSQFLQKYGEHADIVEAIAKHHAEYAQGLTLLTIILQSANSLSAFRPGARKEFLEKSIERLKDMEKLVLSNKGIEQAFVIRAGKEIRAIISPTILDDEATVMLVRTLSKKLKQEFNTANSVKVTMIREAKLSVVAK